MAPRLGPASILIAAAVALAPPPAAAQTPPPASAAPPPASAAPPSASAAPPLDASQGGYLPPRPLMKRQDQDMFNGGIALLVAGGIGLVVGTALLVRTEGGLSLTREIGGGIAFATAGLSFVAAIPLLVLGAKKVPVADAPVSVGIGSIKVRF